MRDPALPEVVAHRGSNEDEPEHSLAAYLQAIDDGADAVECDIRLTADGTLVCVHDRRIDRTSTGRGVVSRLTLAQLMAHDFSGPHTTWRDFESPPPDGTRTGVLTLRTLLATLLDTSPTIGFAIEAKHPVRFGRYVELSLVELLEYFGLARPRGRARVRVMSFSATALRRVRRLAPELPTVLLMDLIPRWRRDGSLPSGIPTAGVSVERLHTDPGYVERVRRRGGSVHVWTVDDPQDADLCLDLGVEAIISNRPAMVRDRRDRRQDSQRQPRQ